MERSAVSALSCIVSLAGYIQFERLLLIVNHISRYITTEIDSILHRRLLRNLWIFFLSLVFH